MNKSLLPYEFYTDGSAKGNDAAHRSGGWAYVMLYDGDIIRRDSGNVLNTTNQRMELQAVIEALKAREDFGDETSEYYIYSDSASIIKCYDQGWYIGWEMNGWRNAARKEVANQDLWTQIIPYFKRKSYHFKKVKGHDTDYYNNFVDKMAQEAASKMSNRGS